MTTYRYSDLDKLLEEGLTSTCISVNGARIIIPTACDQVVGFTNPDDLDVKLLKRWKNGERGPEFENQKLQPGECLVMYNNGRNINAILAEDPDWYKTADGIKNMINRLYTCAECGGKMTEPAIWNSNLVWATDPDLKVTTTSGQRMTKDLWNANLGTALEVIKTPVEQHFIHLLPDDVVIFPDGTPKTAGAMSAIAVKQPDKTWNIVQLNAKGYAVVHENIRAMKMARKGWKGLSKTMEELREKQEALDSASRKPREALENAVRNGLKDPDKIMEMRKKIEQERLKEARKRYGLPPIQATR